MSKRCISREYCLINLYHEWVSETRGEAMMSAVTQGYSIEGGHPHEAANEAVRGNTAPKPCSLCKTDEEERYGHAQLTGQELYDHDHPPPLENPMDWEK